ncbi:MAG: TetR/AcrR family transcriptional regulator [Mycobacteriaceae bacterium]
MRADARANRQSIIDAAQRLFGVQGVDVPLTTVADEAGTGIATLYRNFPTRGDLVDAVIRDLSTRLGAIESSHLPRIREDPERGWPELVHALAELRPGALIPALIDGFEAIGATESVERLRREVLVFSDELLGLAREAGLVRDDVTSELLQMSLATITRPLINCPDHPCDEHEDWLIDAFLRGIRPS